MEAVAATAAPPVEQVAVRTRARERQALVSLCAPHVAGVFDFIQRIVRDRDAAAEISRSVFSRAREHDGPDEAKPWLYAVARRNALAALRNRRRLNGAERRVREDFNFTRVDANRLTDASRVLFVIPHREAYCLNLGRFSAIALLVAFSCAAPGTAGAYGWPIKPFDRQHAIRGNFGDPRTLRGSIDAVGTNPLSFHAGVDIQAPDGTPVYAIEAGVAVLTGPTAVAVGSPYAQGNAPLLFGYWHIDPAVAEFQYVARHQLVGYVHRGAGHVHLAERRYGQFVNPLRAGALAPYEDHQAPIIRRIIFYRSGTSEELAPDSVSAAVDIAVDAYDAPPVVPQPPWSGVVLSPARIRWGGLFDGPWFPLAYRAQSVDFMHLPTVPVGDVYAHGTWQNAANEPGDYGFWLVRGLNTTVVEGKRAIWVRAEDARGNARTAVFHFTVQEAPPAGSP